MVLIERAADIVCFVLVCLQILVGWMALNALRERKETLKRNDQMN